MQHESEKPAALANTEKCEVPYSHVANLGQVCASGLPGWCWAQPAAGGPAGLCRSRGRRLRRKLIGNDPRDPARMHPVSKGERAMSRALKRASRVFAGFLALGLLSPTPP